LAVSDLRLDRPAIERKPRWGRRLGTALLALMVVPPLTVLAHRLVPQPLTFLMTLRLTQGEGLQRSWRPMSRISPNLAYAVIAAEDANFCRHHGFDIAAIGRALKHNESKPSRIRGGSTISQQTAKNVFLWPGRGWIRKGLEAGYTVLIEALWGKRRTLEVYLNSVEWGPGVYGAQSAARHWYGVDADDLTPRQAAGLAAILPSPLKWKAASGGPYVRGRIRRIQAAMGTVRNEGLARCVLSEPDGAPAAPKKTPRGQPRHGRS
jgi:monofunctional biosynthetic peptidoglycan transglycosylase